MPSEAIEHEATLLSACLDGEPGAFDRLIERYRGLVRHAVRAALARTGAAGDEELFDEAVVRVYTTLAVNDMKVLRSFQGRSRLGTFVSVVARRVALRTRDERSRGPGARGAGARGDGDVLAADELPSSVDGPGEVAERREASLLVREALGALPPRDALALRLFYEQGLKHREVGEALGVPTTHVGQILARARRKVRGLLARTGLGEG